MNSTRYRLAPAADTWREQFNRARAQDRAARRLASRASHIATWWAALPEPRPPCLTPLALTVALAHPLRRMAAALRWLGWQRIVRRVHTQQVVLWLPPGSSLIPRKPGRPRAPLSGRAIEPVQPIVTQERSLP